MKGPTRIYNRGVVVLATAIAIVALGATVVVASHDFSDVATGAYYHSYVSWLVDRNITGGCGGTKYCPGSYVKRGDMAIFLQKTAGVASPKYVTNTGGSGALDLDAAPVLCQTSAHTPTYEQVARVDSWASVEAAGDLDFYVRNVYSTNGGSSWTSLDSAAVSRAGATAADQWAHANNSAVLNLSPGTAYMFGVQVGRINAGTNDGTDHRCEVFAQIDNRNP